MFCIVSACVVFFSILFFTTTLIAGSCSVLFSAPVLGMILLLKLLSVGPCPPKVLHQADGFNNSVLLDKLGLKMPVQPTCYGTVGGRP